LVVSFSHIWEDRNEAWNSTDKPNPVCTCGKILAYVDLIKEHLFKNSSATRCESTSPPQRMPPAARGILVNSDTSVFETMGRIGAGIIARDHWVACLVSCRQQLHGLAPSKNAEALALRRAVSLTCDEGFGRIIFATYCLSLVHRLNSSGMDRSHVGLLVDGIKALTNSFMST
jgi:hypothetical protein